MRTNLLPQEIIVERVIRNKKPWTVAALSILLGGMVAHHAMKGQALGVVDAPVWAPAETAVATLTKRSADETTTDSALMAKSDLFTKVGLEVGSGASRRLQTLELLKVISAAKNQNPELADKTPEELPYNQRQDFHFTSIEQKYFADLERWFTPDLKAKYMDGVKNMNKFLKVAPPLPELTPLTGPGWVIEIKGYHFFNGIKGQEGQEHVQNYLINFLLNGSIELEVDDKTGINPPEGAPPVPAGRVALRDLGIRLPIVRYAPLINKDFKVPNPAYWALLQEQRMAAGAGGAAGMPGGGMGPGMGGMGPGGGMGSGMGPGAGMGSGGGMGSGMGGMGSGMGGMGGEGGYGAAGTPLKPLKDANGKEVPPEFAAPLSEFVVQFAWKPRLDPEGGSAAGGLPSAEGEATSTDETTTETL
jgi:type IV pilus assembly protein PilM